MTTKILTATLIVASTLLFLACKSDKLEPIYKSGNQPGKVVISNIESFAGAVKITYTLPSDRDLLYVVAEYTDKYGKKIENKSSGYTNTIHIEGFADTASYDVNLYAVSRTEVKSEMTTTRVKALLPPVYQAHKTLKMLTDFGGIHVALDNQWEAALAIVVCYKDSLGKYVDKETHYTTQPNIAFSARGFASEETDFGIYLRDRWNNRTDTLFQTLTPIFEKELEKSKFRAVTLPTDVAVGWGLPIPNLWDNVISGGNMWHSTDAPMPMHFTFDLGVTAQISRFTLWQRQGTWIYSHGNPKRYEIWGSVNPPSDGSWNNWYLLASRISEKPSKQPAGTNTNEDVNAAERGEETMVPIDAPKARYIRVKVLESWVGAGGMAAHISEMTFYGNDNN